MWEFLRSNPELVADFVKEHGLLALLFALVALGFYIRLERQFKGRLADKDTVIDSLEKKYDRVWFVLHPMPMEQDAQANVFETPGGNS